MFTISCANGWAIVVLWLCRWMRREFQIDLCVWPKRRWERQRIKKPFVQSCTKNESLHVIKNLTATTTTKVCFIYCTKKPDWCVHYAHFSAGAFFRSIRFWHCYYVDVDIVCFGVAIFRTNTKHANVQQISFIICCVQHDVVILCVWFIWMTKVTNSPRAIQWFTCSYGVFF